MTRAAQGGGGSLQQEQRRQRGTKGISANNASQFLRNQTHVVYLKRMQPPCAAAAAPFSCVEDSDKWRSVRMSRPQPADRPRLICFVYFNSLHRSFHSTYIYTPSRKYLRFPRHLACDLLFFSNAAHFRLPLSYTRNRQPSPLSHNMVMF